MAQTNFTDDENHKTFIELWCSAEFIRGVDGELLFISALNIFLSISAFLRNTLILVALHKETSLYPPSKLLYRNLAITDLCVGIIVEPLNATYWTSVVNKRWNILILLSYNYIGTAFCLVTTTFAYTKIFCTLRHNQIHVQNHFAPRQPNQEIPLNIARYRKAVYSALWVQGTLVVCYLPVNIVYT